MMMLSFTYMSLSSKYPNKNTMKDPKNNNHTEHALDGNALRLADVDEMYDILQGRGQHNRLAKRIQASII